ncbi:MAG TPA: response regulator [Pirellulaceae bacterium]|nr:response regulator [Pirellulaceae bacterium]
MTDSPRILVIEDEPEIRRFLRASLLAQRFLVEEAPSGREGILKAKSQPPELVLLDLGLPDISGFDVIQELRAWSSIPIVILSARGQESDKVAALDAGADDYLTKPFAAGELLARIRVALRHQAKLSERGQSNVFSAGRLEVDLAKRQVRANGSEVHLTPTEYRLLTILVKNAGKVVTHRQLLREVWGPDSSQETHYLRVYVNQLRRKLGDTAVEHKLILTEPGVGYRLCVNDMDGIPPGLESSSEEVP